MDSKPLTRSQLLVVAIFLVNFGVAVFLLSRSDHQQRAHGEVIHETTSDYSQIRIRERDGIRSLFFVDAQGREQRQSAINLHAPEELQLAYSRNVFASMLFRYPQERILIVGLGGGGMVRFLTHAQPAMQIEAVEIDPVVVDLAMEYFGVQPGPTVTLHTADAFVFLREPCGPYDAIYMDAFLRPPEDSDLEEIPQRLKTAAFLRDVRTRLTPEGVLVFNLIQWELTTEDDLASIREVFPQVYVFSVPGTGNLAVIASQETTRYSRESL